MGRTNTARAEALVTLNGKAAENAIDGLKVKAKQLRDAIAEASRAGDAKMVNKLSTELKSTEATMKKLRKETFDYNNILKNLNGSSITQLERAAKALRSEMRGLAADSPLFNKTKDQLEIVRNRLDQLNGRAKESHNWLSRAGNSFNKYWGIVTAGLATITGMSFALRNAAQEAAKMDDIYADVMKTTGLLREEVVELNEEFKKLNTRTSREDLNALARDAGKLGISAKEDVLQFVKAANQINVALGEDLGEGAIRNIGKISEVFQKTKELGIEKAFLSIGSSINALGQASTASEEYLVEFTQRLAGAAYQSGMSVQNVLGWASALDQTGNKVEMSATAFQNFLMKMFSETETFAKMANMSLGDFSSLLQTDVNQAIITVLTAMNQKGGFAQLVPMFKEMGADGARAVSVLSSLATNIGLVTEAQSLSNVEYQKATSLTNEYNVKNENKQAQLEKAKKAFKDEVIILGDQLSPALLKTTNLSTLFLKLIMAIPKAVYAFIAAGGTAVLIYKSWNLVIGVWNTLVAASKVVTLAWSAAMYLMEGRTLRAAVAWRQMNAAMSASVIGAIVSAVVALGYGLYKIITYESELTKTTRNYYSEVEKATRSAGQLLDVLKNSAKGSQQYKEALAALQKDYGPYIDTLINEQGVLTDIEGARTAINTAIKETIALKVQEQAITDVANKAIDKQSGYYEKMISVLMRQGNLSEDVARITAKSFTDAIKSGEPLSTAFLKVEKQIEKTRGALFNKTSFIDFAKSYEKMGKDIDEINKRFDFLNPSNNSNDVPLPGGETTAQFKARREKEERERRDAEANFRQMSEEDKEKAFKKELDRIEQMNNEKMLVIKEGLLKGQITQQTYDDIALAYNVEMLQKRIDVYKKFGKDSSEVELEYYDALIRGADATSKRAEEAAKVAERWLKNLQNIKEDIEEDPEQEKLLKSISDDQKALEEKAKALRKDYAERTWREKQKVERENLDKMYSYGLITTKEYEWKIGQMRIEAATEVMSEINSIVNSIADLYQTIRDAEFDRLERQKEQELRLYGDNADSRAQIEQKYEKEKLKLQIEYADKDMAIKILQTVSAGALAAVQAVAQLGPIAGAIAAGIIAATTALQIGTIVAQRNALKSSYSETSSSSSANLKGYSDGGFTGRSRSDRDAVGVVHANEWVAPAWMVRMKPTVFRNLESERVSRYSIQSPPKQFASGGYTSPGTSRTDELLEVVIKEINALNRRPIQTYTVLDESNAAQELRSKFKTAGSL